MPRKGLADDMLARRVAQTAREDIFDHTVGRQADTLAAPCQEQREQRRGTAGTGHRATAAAMMMAMAPMKVTLSQ